MKHETTRNEHQKRLLLMLKRFLADLDQEVDLATLADWCAISPYHFHRVFQALLQESPVDLVRRLRLERAAHQISVGNQSIGDIAHGAGYATHAAFNRAFRDAFGSTPSKFKQRNHRDGHLPTPNGIHFDDAELARIRFHQGDPSMQYDLRESEGFRLFGLDHKGPYYLIGGTFDKLSKKVQPLGPAVAIYYDDPSETPEDQLRSLAGMIAPKGIPVPDGVRELILEPGLFAVGTHIGPYDGLGHSWSTLYGQLSNDENLDLRASPCFELYLDDCSQVEPATVRTEMWIPVEKVQQEASIA
jgi:AraC family transcriptional regulator